MRRRWRPSTLEQALADPAIEAEAAAIIRSQIERITLTPNAEGGLEVLLHGDLARILEICEAGESGKDKRPGTNAPGRELSVVAGARNHLCRTVMPWT